MTSTKYHISISETADDRESILYWKTPHIKTSANVVPAMNRISAHSPVFFANYAAANIKTCIIETLLERVHDQCFVLKPYKEENDSRYVNAQVG
uniref:Uncharacterized protein n=1 Tax=Rhipicephalus appendiculatus TaxID=34631 RepID=A0A131Y948_RHIAP